MAATLTIYPDPPVHGELLSISTDGETPKKLTVTWTPDSLGSRTVVLEEAKEVVMVPATATDVTIHDQSEECPDVSRVVA